MPKPKPNSNSTSLRRMGASLGLACATALLLASSLPARAQAPDSASPAASAIDPAVLQRLKDVGAYLRTLKAFTVSAEATTDEILGTGQKIQFASKVDYSVGGAHLMRVSVRSDRRQRDYYFDGKTLTQVAPRAGYYASVPLQGTIGQMLTAVAERYEIEVPLADLFLWGTPAAGLEELSAATLIGPAKIGGLEAEHFALRQAGVDWQVWVQKGAQPLPLKMVITTTDEAAQPQYAATLRWDLKARPAAKDFSFVPGKGMSRIELKPASTASTTP